MKDKMMKYDSQVNEISSSLVKTTQELIRIRSVEDTPVER